MTFWREPGTGLGRTDDTDVDRAVTAYWRHRPVAGDVDTHLDDIPANRTADREQKKT